MTSPREIGDKAFRPGKNSLSLSLLRFAQYRMEFRAFGPPRTKQVRTGGRFAIKTRKSKCQRTTDHRRALRDDDCIVLPALVTDAEASQLKLDRRSNLGRARLRASMRRSASFYLHYRNNYVTPGARARACATVSRLPSNSRPLHKDARGMQIRRDGGRTTTTRARRRACTPPLVGLLRR